MLEGERELVGVESTLNPPRRAETQKPTSSKPQRFVKLKEHAIGGMVHELRVRSLLS